MDNHEREMGEIDHGTDALEDELAYMNKIKTAAHELQNMMFGANRKSENVTDFSDGLDDLVAELNGEINSLKEQIASGG